MSKHNDLKSKPSVGGKLAAAFKPLVEEFGADAVLDSIDDNIREQRKACEMAEAPAERAERLSGFAPPRPGENLADLAARIREATGHAPAPWHERPASPPVEPLVRLAEGVYARPSAVQALSGGIDTCRLLIDGQWANVDSEGPEDEEDCRNGSARRVAALLGIPVVDPEDVAEARANAMGLTTKPYVWPDEEREREAARRLPKGMRASVVEPGESDEQPEVESLRERCAAAEKAAREAGAFVKSVADTLQRKHMADDAIVDDIREAWHRYASSWMPGSEPAPQQEPRVSGSRPYEPSGPNDPRPRQPGDATYSFEESERVMHGVATKEPPKGDLPETFKALRGFARMQPDPDARSIILRLLDGLQERIASEPAPGPQPPPEGWAALAPTHDGFVYGVESGTVRVFVDSDGLNIDRPDGAGRRWRHADQAVVLHVLTEATRRQGGAG